jgi:hypothetical protein
LLHPIARRRLFFAILKARLIEPSGLSDVSNQMMSIEKEAPRRLSYPRKRVSSTPQHCGSIIGALEYWVAQSSRAMTLLRGAMPSLPGRRYLQTPARWIVGGRPQRVFAARSGRDQEGCCQQDRHRQRCGNKYDR